MDREKPKSRKRNSDEPLAPRSLPKRTTSMKRSIESESSYEEVGGKIDAEYSGMKEPPLIKQLKRILSEYPDNGQIIKELIQNAEDAEASEVQVIYDERRINEDYTDQNWFTKFFRGPALCVTNDAKFTEQDWTGIKMIASSVKEENKLKVGRFGMGFKSVFHMTDFPCILSGDRILCIDPTGASDKINAEMKLKHLRRYKGMDVAAFFKAFEETIGVTDEVIETGHYDGTAFWFPLRCQPSDISPTLYDNKKTMDLFMSFAHDAPVTLLFLCHLVKLSLKIKYGESSELEEIITAAVAGDTQSIIKERSLFIKAIKEKVDMEHEPIICTFDMNLDVCCQNEKRSDTWRIMHYYIGQNASEQLRALGSNPDLGFCQWVGLALPINSSAHEHFESRVFCFMPLPKDSQKLTGLPVHVNGFFALSQNRHHLKWPTDDQQVEDVTDQDIIWNRLLIDECLVEAYKEMVKITKGNLTQQRKLDGEEINVLYRLIPDQSEVLEKWERLIKQLRSFIQSFDFLYSMHQNKFLTLNNSSFAILKDLPIDISHIKADIIQTLEIFNVPYVGVEESTFEKLTYYSDCQLNDLTPSKFADILRQNVRSFDQMTVSRKYSILSYLLSGKDNSILQNLPLIHTAGGWRPFEQSEDVIYVCSLEQVPHLFPSVRSKVVVRTEDMSEYVWTHMGQIAKRNDSRLRELCPRTVSEFIEISMDEATNGSGVNLGPGKMKWFEDVWRFLDNNIKKGNIQIDDLKDLRLVPEITRDSQANQVPVNIHKLSSYFLEESEMTSTEICKAFSALGVIILPQLPEWFPKHRFKTSIFSSDGFSSSDISAIANRISKEKIDIFNSLTDSTKDFFLKFLSTFDRFDRNTISVLKQLKLFSRVAREKKGHFDMSINESTGYLRERFPVDISEPVIEATLTDTRQLLVKLGTGEVNKETIVGACLKEIQNNTFKDDFDVFMKYFCDNFGLFEDYTELINLAKEVPFLKMQSGERKRPREVFDPTANDLKTLFEYENNKFPVLDEFDSERRLSALRKLGLRGMVSITAEDIASTALKIQSLEGVTDEKSKIRQKSLSLMNVLEKSPYLIQEQYGKQKLVDYLRDIKWVQTVEKPKYLPQSLCVHNDMLCKPLVAKVGSFRNACLVAAVLPLVSENFENLGKEFGWFENPLKEDVLEQLKYIRKLFRIEEKAATISLLDEIYNYFSHLPTLPSSLISEKWVWIGHGFEAPENILVSIDKYDIESLAPYFFRVPNEFTKYKSVFQKAECHAGQTIHVLMSVIDKIKEKHKLDQKEDEYEKDFNLLLTVIEKLAERRKDLEGRDVPLPIKSDQQSRILCLPASKCTVDKNSCSYTLSDVDDSFAFVSDRLSIDVAKALGAKPLDKQILSGTETMGICGFGQKEKLTDRLRKLVEESYKDGVSVPKELIQNADDAGASVVKFLYDEREHQGNTLFSTEMEQCQGPSLLVYNNAAFSKSDMENITKLNGATKENDTNKIGRFGLGFCAVYNLTDVPSFITRNSFVTFDPNKTHLAKFVDADSPGIRIDFNRHENHKLMKIYADQFRPFEGIFGFEKSCLKGNGYDGTLFRFPFRTRIQAQKSEIRNFEYSTQEILQLLEMFITDASNLLLFTQNVCQLELHYLSRNATSMMEDTLVYKTQRCELQIFPPVSEDTINGTTVLKRASESIKSHKDFKEVHRFMIHVYLSKIGKRILPKLIDVPMDCNFPLLVVWESEKTQLPTSSKEFERKGALPLAAVAALCEPDFAAAVSFKKSQHYIYDSGRFFCYLPLPIKTGLGVHINCSFDVTSDRQRLTSSTDDDKQYLKNEWNHSLLTNAAVNGLFSLFEGLAKNEKESKDYYHLWPINHESIAEPVHVSFFTRLIAEDRPIFYGQGKFVSFANLIYLDPQIRNNPDIGEQGYDMLLSIANFGNKVVVDIPFELEKALKKYHDVSSAVIREKAFIEILLKNINHKYWIDNTIVRNKLLVFALKSEDTTARSLMLDCACIPVKPNGILKRPSDTVDQKGEVSCLFDIDDEVFPLQHFQTDEIRESLKCLGMMTNKVKANILNERCFTVGTIAKNHCTECALQRCREILRYLLKMGITHGKCVNDNKSKGFTFPDVHLLPVLRRPDDWIFTWYACTDSKLIQSHSSCPDHSASVILPVFFGKPSCLFRSCEAMLIGMVASLIDEAKFGHFQIPSSIWHDIGVKLVIPTDFVIKQMVLVSEKTNDRIRVEMQEVLRQSYLFLRRAIEQDSAVCTLLTEKLNNKKIIIIEEKLYYAKNVAFNLHRECRPFLNRLPQNEISLYKDVFQAIGVREHFSVDDIISVLKQQQIMWRDSICTEIDTIISLLENLLYISPDLDFSSPDLRGDIIGPDINGNLYPMHELAIADDAFETDMILKILHKSVPPSLAKRLGAKMKKQKCLENSFSFIGKPFGQKEKLVKRLNNLLQAYPCDSSIMKELLQNADDAKATEIVFIKDFRNLPTDNIFSDECKHFQGPSLCVFNDKYFTDDDLQGIQDLGEGSKSEDATKTGQYGVGFNAVYHLTDTPSFLTNGPTLPDDGLLCIFDPTCRHIPGVRMDNPGIQCKVRSLQRNFPGALLGYHEGQKLFRNNIGTIFRFPLRIKPSDISNNILTPNVVDDMLRNMTGAMFDSLMFVKYVQHIRISDISVDSFEDIYSVSSEISEDHSYREGFSRRDDFFSDIKDISSKLRQEEIQMSDITKRQTSYKVKIVDTEGRNETYFVVLRFGFENSFDISETVVKAIEKRDIGCLPVGGVAVRTSEQPLNDSKAFCFLPLPGTTGLPVHINGHFALNHESRRELWRGDEEQNDYRQEWNESIIRGVIVPAYLECLDIQTVIIAREIGHTRGVYNKSYLEKRLLAFYTMFPVYQECKIEYWKLLTKQLYTRIINEKLPLFPVFEENFLSSEWVPLGRFDETAYGYFNYPCENNEKLVSTLKLIGMKVVHSPVQLKETMEETGIKGLLCISPDVVLEFLSTSGNPGTNSKLSRSPTNLLESPIRSVQNWIILLLHISQSRRFEESLLGLPLFLANDGYLRPFEKIPALYKSNYSWMFPDFQNRFIHSKATQDGRLQNTICNITQAGFLCELSMHAFEEFVPRKYRDLLEIDDHILTRTEHPHNDWIVSFWKLLFEITKRDQAKGYKVTFRENAFRFAKWCLIPAVISGELKTVKVEEAHILMNLESFVLESNIHLALEKLSLPSLDERIFTKGGGIFNHVISSLLSKLKDLTTSHQHPERLLDCLLFWVQRKGPDFIQDTFDQNDAVSILTYLANRLCGTRLWKEHSCEEKLCSLPLFVSMTGALCALNGDFTVYTIPPSFPLDGLDRVMRQSKIVLLKPFVGLDRLFEHLSLKSTGPDILYAEMILPNINLIPRDLWIQHITFLKDFYFTFKGQELNYSFTRIMNYLKSIPFIQTEQGYKKCSDFYHHTNRVFQKMCQPYQFLPRNFLQNNWPEFISVLGLQKEVTDDMLIRFAEEIENSQIENVALKERSEVLTQCFINKIDHWNEKTLEKVKSIRFIKQVDLPNYCFGIFPQRQDGRYLICTNGSAMKQNRYLCWSTLTVLPFDVPDQKKTILGINDVSRNVEVLKHIQNISTILENKIENVHVKDVVFLMRRLYEFLKHEQNVYDDVWNDAKVMLCEFPIIHLQKEVKMVKAIDVVINLPKADELRPYLFNAPHNYGEFFGMFERMGVSTELQCCHCLNILFKVYVDANKAPVFISEMRHIKGALSRLNTFLESGATGSWGSKKMYIPNTENIMSESTDLVFCDNNRLRERAKISTFNYFLGFGSLDLGEIDTEKFVKRLPENLRPQLLTNIVKERFDTSRVEEVKHSLLASRLTSYIRSTEFIVGACRITKKFTEEHGRQYDKTKDVKRIKDIVLQIHVREVTKLETVLEYDGALLPDTRESRPCFHERDETKLNFYFTCLHTSKEETLSDIICSTNGLARVIVQCMELPFEAEMTVLAILRKYNDPLKVSQFLDEERFPSLEFDSDLMSAFPTPGTYVDEKFHPFLEQALALFDESEYLNVALQLDDGFSEGDELERNPVYIYVHIISEIEHPMRSRSSLITKYIVDTGEDAHTIVPAYKLFRFVRRQKTTDEIVVYTRNIPTEYLPLDENRRRIETLLREAWTLDEDGRRRIIRRLLLQWHPDKNIGNEDYARQVFDFIKQMVERLGREQPILYSSSTHGRRHSPNYYFNIFTNVERRASTYARAYRNNLSQYNRCYGTGHYSHTSARQAVVKDEFEARRWMKQAKLDFRAAKEYFEVSEDPSAYNWICYTCHQASEKALKAYQYATNANLISRLSHDIAVIAHGMPSPLPELANELATHVGQYSRMRYPDMVNRPKIPAEIYTKDKAEKAMELAKKILENVDELIS